MMQFDYQGNRVHYQAVGSGPPLLFLHNGGSSHAIWQRQLDHFAGTRECIAFDLPGYGESPSFGAKHTLGGYVDLLSAFIDEMKLGPVSLVGNCVGSAISLTYAIRHPGRVRKLVLFNILTSRTIRGGSYGRIFRLTEPFPRLRPALRGASKGLVIPSLIRARAVRSQLAAASADPDRLEAELLQLFRRKEQLASLADILVDIDAFRKLDEFEIPKAFPESLVIWGEDNQVLPLAEGRTLVATLKPHRFCSIAGGGHLAMHECASEVNALLDGFLVKSDRAAAAGVA